MYIKKKTKKQKTKFKESVVAIVDVYYHQNSTHESKGERVWSSGSPNNFKSLIKAGNYPN